MKGLVVVAKQRTGTNFLRSLLAQCSNGRNLGEIFHTETQDAAGNFFRWLRETGTDYPAVRLEPDLRAIFNRYLDDMIRDHPVPIIDLKYNSLWSLAPTWVTVFEMPMVLRVLNQRGWRVVHLVRRNRLEQAMSALIARDSGVYVTFQEVTPGGRIIVDCDRLAVMMAQYDREEAQITRLLDPLRKRTDLTYEELNGAPDSVLRPTLRRMLAGTDLAFTGFAPAQTRKIVRDWREHIENAAEVEARFTAEGQPRVAT